MSKADFQSQTSGAADPFLWADFTVWVKRPYWTPQEIAALSLGKDPWSLNIYSCRVELPCRFSWSFLHLLDILQRAIQFGQLPEMCRPSVAIEYLDRFEIECDDELRQEVDRVHRVMDWQAFCRSYMEASKAQKADLTAKIESYRAAWEDAQTRAETALRQYSEILTLVRQLRQSDQEKARRLADLEANKRAETETNPIAANDNCDEELTPKERTSKDRMIAAMAIMGYGFDPANERSPIPADIAGDIAHIGQKLTPEIVAKHIRNACKRLGISVRPDRDN